MFKRVNVGSGFRTPIKKDKCFFNRAILIENSTFLSNSVKKTQGLGADIFWRVDYSGKSELKCVKCLFINTRGSSIVVRDSIGTSVVHLENCNFTQG